MKKSLLIALIFAVSLISVSVAIAAKPNFQAAQVVNPVTEEVKNTVTVPSHAIELAPGLFYLGSVDQNGKKVEGYAKVHYKKDNAKPGTECGNGICEPGENARKCPADCGGGDPGDETSSCYGFLSKGAKWRVVEDYLINPANSRGLDENFVVTNFGSDVNKWETAAETEIIGAGSATSQTLVADTESPDGLNEVYFGEITDSGAIAITIVWGIFSGPPKARELVEWDQVYDQVDYDWSATGEAGKMDFENIVTHELGHTVGLDDLYDIKCSAVTMYGYADNGETDKRSLEAGDVAGVQKLY